MATGPLPEKFHPRGSSERDVRSNPLDRVVPEVSLTNDAPRDLVFRALLPYDTEHL